MTTTNDASANVTGVEISAVVYGAIEQLTVETAAAGQALAEAMEAAKLALGLRRSKVTE
jgi:hypothetical protein